MDYSTKHIYKGVKAGLGTVYYYTTSGLPTLKKISNNRFWDYWNDTGVALLLASMASFLGFLAISASSVILLNPPATEASNPKSLIAIPGINSFIPFEHAGIFLVVLFICVVVHEGGHAIAALREGIEVEEWGIFTILGILPLGAYVKPNEDELLESSIRSRVRVLSAGVLNNYFITLLTILYFVFLVEPSVIEITVDHFSIISGDTTFLEYGTLTTFVYWMFFLNLNLGLVNSLPIMGLDGGRVIGALSEIQFNRTSSRRVTITFSVISLLLFSITAFLPLL